MSRLHEQIKQLPGIAYNRPLTDREASAQKQREINMAWQWYEELREQAEGFDAIEAEKRQVIQSYVDFTHESTHSPR